jgi:hypothetical protein
VTETILGASVWEQQLFDHVSAHVDAEREVLEEYRAIEDDETASPAFRYLAALILDDEVRHHQVFRDLTEAIRQFAEVRSEDDPIPTLRGLKADRERIMTATQRLLDVERADMKELKALAKELSDLKDTTLWVLLLDLMRLDTEKHIRILKFLRGHC